MATLGAADINSMVGGLVVVGECWLILVFRWLTPAKMLVK